MKIATNRIIITLKCSLLSVFLICTSSKLSNAQSRLSTLKGRIVENLTRGDGKSLDIAVPRASVSIIGHSHPIAYTNEKGNFEIKLDKSIRKGEVFQVRVVKPNYGMVVEKNSLKIVNEISLTNNAKLDQNNLKLYITKLPRFTQNNNNEDSRIALNGYIVFQDDIIEDVSVKIKGAEDVYDNTNEQGFFEIYLPSDDFNPQKEFVLLLEKDNKTQEIAFKDLSDFQTHPFITFDKYMPAATSQKNNTTNIEKRTIKKEVNQRTSAITVQNQNMEKNFRQFIDNLDKINLKGLTTAEIKILKDSLNLYADYITDLNEQNQNLTQQSTEYVSLLEKTHAQQQKLSETEKELIRVELENQNKTTVIISMSIILLILSGWIYYYFYVNKKIRIQTEELNKRHQFIDFLLQELNHRVTNNLQVISSMLRRKIRRLPDQNAKAALQEINKRVLDISAIHVGLYSQNDDRPINLTHYIKNITSTLEKLYTFEKNPVKININAPSIEIQHKNAVFFGLIINELVTNAMKYAFHEEENPHLWIEISKKGAHQYLMLVRDNGRGVPSDFSLEKAKSSGLKLVNLITQMLDGTFKMSNEQGSKFEMMLKIA